MRLLPAARPAPFLEFVGPRARPDEHQLAPCETRFPTLCWEASTLRTAAQPRTAAQLPTVLEISLTLVAQTPQRGARGA